MTPGQVMPEDMGRHEIHQTIVQLYADDPQESFPESVRRLSQEIIDGVSLMDGEHIEYMLVWRLAGKGETSQSPDSVAAKVKVLI